MWPFGPPNVEKMKAKSDVKGLVKTLGNWSLKDWTIRVAAAEALGQIGDARAVPSLCVALNARNNNVRGAAALALGAIGDARAVEPLLDALHRFGHGDHRVIGALGVIGDARAVEPLIGQLGNSVVGNPTAAAEALGRIGDARAVEPLIAVLKSGGGLYAHLVRGAAAEALGSIGDARAIEPLIALLGDREEGVRNTAEEALVKIGTPAVEPLIAALNIGNEYLVRRAAAKALGLIGDARAIEPLRVTISNDCSLTQGVREAAAEALAKIEPHTRKN